MGYDEEEDDVGGVGGEEAAADVLQASDILFGDR